MDNVLFILATDVSWLLSLLRTLLERVSSSFYRIFLGFINVLTLQKCQTLYSLRSLTSGLRIRKKPVNFLYELIKFRSSFNAQIQYNSEEGRRIYL